MKYLNFFYIVLIGLLPVDCITGQDDNIIIYPDGPKPGDQPILFAKGPVSIDGKNTHACTFSPDGRMLIFSRYPDGKYMFFTRLNFSGNTGYVYWVSTNFVNIIKQK